MTLASETWKPIPGFPGYDASDHGRVRSYYARKQGGGGTHGWYMADTPQRILRICNTNGYRYVNVATDNGDFIPTRVHHLVLLAFIGPCPDGMEVCHNDGNRANNNLSNLRYDTHAANMREASESGNMAKVLDNDTAAAIRHLHANGQSYPRIADRLGISPSNARSVGAGLIWKHADGPCGTVGVNVKLSDADILAIIERASNEKQRDLAAEYSVSESMISRIVNGKRRLPTNGNGQKQEAQ